MPRSEKKRCIPDLRCLDDHAHRATRLLMLADGAEGSRRMRVRHRLCSVSRGVGQSITRGVYQPINPRSTRDPPEIHPRYTRDTQSITRGVNQPINRSVHW